MAEFSGFFDANIVNGEYDRVYLAESFAKYFASFIGNGVYAGKSSELMVSQNAVANMGIRVLTGQGFINGYFYENTEELQLTIDAADGVLNRIDIIVLRWSKINRAIRLAVKKGAAASTAVAPIVERSGDNYELELAQVFVKAGTTKIEQANVTDMRLDSNVCGFVEGVIKQFDTTAFGEQLNSFITKYVEDYEAWFKEFVLKSEEEIKQIKEELDKIVADNDLVILTRRVTELESEAAVANQTLGYSKKNLIPYPYNATKVGTGITWTDNGDGTITANGTALDDSYFYLYKGEMIKPGRYYITSDIDSSAIKYYVYVLLTNKEDESIVKATYRSFENTPFEITELDVQECNILIGIVVGKDTTVSNVVFKPMLRRAEIVDATWEPYKLSVDEMIKEDETEIGCFYRINRVTGVKEWINPPLKYGVEYCITERWNNKPVYQKTFYLSTLPNKSVASLSTGTQWDRVISIDAYALDSNDLTYYHFPIILQGRVTPIAVISSIESDGTLTITTIEDASNFKAYVTVKYTKQ